MDLRIYSDYNELSREAAQLIMNIVNAKPSSLLCLAAGHTPVGIYNCLVGFAREKQVDLSSCKFVGLDEWVGLGMQDEGSCIKFMHHHLFTPLGVLKSNIAFFNGQASDLELECHRIDEFVFKNGPIDVVLLGIGMNGHIGFNEPGTAFDTYSHVAMLDKVTKEVGKKYFPVQRELDKGLTLGIKHFLEARNVILVASGSGKADIIKKTIESPPDRSLPATALKLHQNFYLLLDKEAASLL
jgi:glucosamine-6-phosphate deaminase